MKELNITATKWSGGWELWDDKEVLTQVRTLARARQQVIDYLDTVEEGVDHSAYVINILPELPAEAGVADALAASAEAERASLAASRASRKAVRVLRRQGFSLADIGYVMGLSRARASQLAKA